MRAKVVTVTVLGLLAATLPATAASGAPLDCPAVVEVPGGWLLTEDAACNLRLPGTGATFDFGGHTLTGGVLPLDRDQTMRNGTLVITGSQAWNGGFTVSRVTVRPLVPGGCPEWCIDGGRVTVEHSTLRDIGGAALNFYNGGGATIRHSVFIGNGAGIVVDLGGSVRMEHNWFIDNQVAVSLNTHDGEGVDHNTVASNLFWGNETGVTMAHDGTLSPYGPSLSHNRIQDNQFWGNRNAGLRIEVSCTVDGYSECLPPVDNVIAGNQFWGNGFRPSNASAGDDGITARGILYGPDRSTTEDFPEALAGFTLTGNQAYFNADLAFDVVGVVDGGGNRARFNWDRAQCAGVDC